MFAMLHDNGHTRRRTKKRPRDGYGLHVEPLEGKLLLAAVQPGDADVTDQPDRLGPFYAVIAPNGREGDGQTSVVYDAETGKVQVDAPAGIELTSIHIRSASGIFTRDPADNLGGSFDTDEDNGIFKATYGSSFGDLDFGQVARSGLSEAYLLGDLTVAGSLAVGGSLGHVDLVYIGDARPLYATIAPNGQDGDSQTSVIYDANTGEVSVDAPAGTELTSIHIRSASGIFTGDPAEHLGGMFDTDEDTGIFKATYGSNFGDLDFGHVAQPGLSKEYVLGDLTVAGSLSVGGGLGAVDLIYIGDDALLVVDAADPNCADSGDAPYCQIPEAVDVTADGGTVEMRSVDDAPVEITTYNPSIAEARMNLDTMMDATGARTVFLLTKSDANPAAVDELFADVGG